MAVRRSRGSAKSSKSSKSSKSAKSAKSAKSSKSAKSAKSVRSVERGATAPVPAERATHPNAAAFPPGIAGPALRALANAGIRSMSDLARWSMEDLAALHGMGPKASQRLLAAQANGTGRSR